MQVISFMAIKGGVGKTTMAFQFAKYLQENNKSTLLIDLDSQKSLTGTFETKDFNFKYLQDKKAEIIQFLPEEQYNEYKNQILLSDVMRLCSAFLPWGKCFVHS